MKTNIRTNFQVNWAVDVASGRYFINLTYWLSLLLKVTQIQTCTKILTYFHSLWSAHMAFLLFD